MRKNEAASSTNKDSEAERIALDHLILVRCHMEDLSSIIQKLRKMSFCPQSIVCLRCAFLHVRMVIEELMLLSVSAHQEAGEAVTQSLRTEYRADKKMRRLRTLNARFFPDAIDIAPFRDPSDPKITFQLVQVADEYMTEQEAKSYYNQSGDKLHASWRQTSAETFTQDKELLERFLRLTSRLLATFEIDISGQGYMMLGQLNLREPKAPSLFFTKNG